MLAFMDQIQATTSAEIPAEVGIGVMDGDDAGVLEPEKTDDVELAELPVEAADILDSEQTEGAGMDELPVEEPDVQEPEEENGGEMGELPVEEPDVQEPQEENGGEMGELPVEDWDYQRPKRGQVRSGVILSIEGQEIIVDVGAKRDGIVPYADMQRMGDEGLADLSVGDQVSVYVLRPEDREGNLLVSLYLARQEQAWQRARDKAEKGEAWEVQVIGFNKGGLVVPVDDIRGFVPASQVPGFPRGLGQEERLERLAAMVDETLLVKVIEINRHKRRLILSATAAQRQWRKQHRKRLLDELREGEVRRGRVSSLCNFGAFVDLGGADGLVHLSELSWRRVRHPREVVSVGADVEVYVLRLDRERKRIGLSLKRLQPEPWALVEDSYELGQLIEGVVTNVVDFGAFAEIEAGIEGLIHVSELTDGSISHPREVVKKGDLLLLRIIRIDARRKRLGLSLKRVLESEWAEWAARLAVEGAGEPKKMEEPGPADVDGAGEPAAVAPQELREEAEPEVPEAETIEVASITSEDLAEEEERAEPEAEAIEVASITSEDPAEEEEREEPEVEEIEEVAAIMSEELAEEAAPVVAEAEQTEVLAATRAEGSTEKEELGTLEAEAVTDLTAAEAEEASPGEPDKSQGPTDLPDAGLVEVGTGETPAVEDSELVVVDA
jgi:small subunit ribosomal protein S1